MKKGISMMILLMMVLGCTNIKKERQDIILEKGEKVRSKKFKYEGYKLSDKELKRGYFFKGDNVIFVLDKNTHKKFFQKEQPESLNIKNAYLSGTFNYWNSGDNDWKMTKSTKKERWYLEKEKSQINVPGNSGQPEFKFYLSGTYMRKGNERLTEVWIKPPKNLEIGYKFNDQWTGGYNYLVVFDESKLQELAQEEKLSRTIKKDYENKEIQANFREVSIGDIKKGVLYRSYHPFIPSRKTDKQKSPQEQKRMALVRDMMETKKVKSIINLTDGKEIYEDERVPEYYKSILDSGDILLAKTKYSIVYHQSDSQEFRDLIKKVVKYISGSKTPILVHCRLGSDRTGIVVAFIAAANSATWNEISDDYDKTNYVGMGEYRDINLLKYSMENMLDIKILSKDQNFSKEIYKYMKEDLNLKEETIDNFYKKLKD